MTQPGISDSLESPLSVLEIGMTATAAKRGGLDRYFFGLCEALPSAKVSPTGLVVGSDYEVRAAGAAFTAFGHDDESFVRRAMGLRRSMSPAMQRVGLVAAHFAPYTLPILDRFGNVPLVFHFHGPWAGESGVEGASALRIAMKKTLERIVYSRAKRFIVLSRDFASVLTHAYGIDRSLIRIIPGGVDLARFRTGGSREDARNALQWPLDRPIVVAVRRLVRAKGVDRLIEAIALVRREIPNVLCRIVGTGPLEGLLRNRIVELGLQDAVELVGYVSDDVLPSIYRAASLVVVPTVELEGFGLIVLESLACGTPTLVTPVGGLPEAVEGLDPGLVMASCEPVDIARAISNVLTGAQRVPDEAECIEYAARFTWRNIAHAVADVYREVVEETA